MAWHQNGPSVMISVRVTFTQSFSQCNWSMARVPCCVASEVCSVSAFHTFPPLSLGASAGHDSNSELLPPSSCTSSR